MKINADTATVTLTRAIELMTHDAAGYDLTARLTKRKGHRVRMIRERNARLRAIKRMEAVLAWVRP